MDENFPNIQYTCLDVDKSTPIQQLAKRLDDLFPGTIVRLKIDGKYSPFFYMGNNLWRMMPKIKQKHKIVVFEAKVYPINDIYDFLSEYQVLILAFFGVEIKNLKLIKDVVSLDQSFHGEFFADGKYILIFQEYVENVSQLCSVLQDVYGCEMLIDKSNVENNGYVMLKATFDILGENHDQSNTQT